MNQFLRGLKDFTKNSDMVIALALVLTLGVMIVPISPLMMDMFIAFTLAGSIIILLVSVYK